MSPIVANSVRLTRENDKLREQFTKLLTETAHIDRELRGALMTIYALVKRAGGEVSLSVAELAETGVLRVSQNDDTMTYFAHEERREGERVEETVASE